MAKKESIDASEIEFEPPAPGSEGADAEATFYRPEMILSEEQQTEVIAAYLLPELDKAENARESEGFSQNLADWRRLRLGTSESKTTNWPWEGACNTMPPALASICNTCMAKLTGMYAVKTPFWRCTTTQPELSPKMPALEKYLGIIASSPQYLDLPRKSPPLFYDVSSLGTAFARVPWLEDSWKFRGSDPATGAVVEKVQKRHSGPAFIPVPIEDLFMRLHWDDPQRAPWVSVRHHISYPELKQREANGYYTNVDRVVALPAAKEPEARTVESQARGLDPSFDSATDYDKTFDIIESFVFYDVDGSGVPVDIKVYWHRETGICLRAEYNNTGWRDIVPFRYITLLGQLYGRGVCEAGRDMQDSITAAYRTRTNAQMLSSFPVFRKLRSATIRDNKGLRPGAIIDVDTPEDFSAIIVPDTSDTTFMSEQSAKRYLEEVTGVNSPMSGYADPVLKSGGGAQAQMVMAQQSDSLFNAVAQGIANSFSEVGALVFMQLVANKTAVDLSMLSEEEAQDVRDVLDSVALEDLPRKMTFTIAPVDLNSTKDARAQKMVAASQLFSQYIQGALQLATMSSNPQVPPDVGLLAKQGLYSATEFMKHALDTFEVPNAADLLPDFTALGKQLALIDLIRNQQGGMNGGQGGPGPLGAPGAIQGAPGFGQGGGPFPPSGGLPPGVPGGAGAPPPTQGGASPFGA